MAGLVMMGVAGPWAVRPAPAQDAEDVAVRLQGVIEVGMAEDRIPGAALVVVDSGRVVLQHGFGVADAATGRPVVPESTLFRIGSITKVFTALGVLRLVEAGRIDLDTPVSAWVPLPSRAVWSEPVRIGHLLAHTGGFDQTGLGRHAASPAERPSLAELVAGEIRPVRPPGVVATYDTYGMTLAGRLIEVVSGQRYAEYMRREVFEPLGMDRTWVEAPAGDRDALAVGYGLSDGRLLPQDYEWYTTMPASSIDATAADMARVLIALLGDGSTDAGPFLTESRVSGLRDSASRDPMRPFSYGFWVGRALGQPVLFHGGVMNGYTSQAILLPDRAAGLFLVYTRDPETGPPPRLRDQVTGAFLTMMLAGNAAQQEAGGEPEATAAGLSPADVAGWWANTSGCVTCDAGEGWPLSAERVDEAGPGALTFRGERWVATGPLSFRAEGSGRTLRFRRDAGGTVRYGNQGQDGLERLDDALIERVAGAMGPAWDPDVLRARVARLKGEWATALPLYRALADRRTAPGFRYYLGLSALHAGEPEQAVAVLSRGGFGPRLEGRAAYYHGAALAALGRRAEARDAVVEARRLGFTDAGALRRDPWWGELAYDPEIVGVLDPTATARLRAMQELASVPAAFSPLGTFELRPAGVEGGEPMRVRVRADGPDPDGWFQPRPDRPRRELVRVIGGGSEVWLVARTPDGQLDFRLTVEGARVTGTLIEGSEEIQVAGRFIPDG
jgi:CubicO group peptidase (beta-lactamase class C family)